MKKSFFLKTPEKCEYSGWEDEQRKVDDGKSVEREAAEDEEEEEGVADHHRQEQPEGADEDAYQDQADVEREGHDEDEHPKEEAGKLGERSPDGEEEEIPGKAEEPYEQLSGQQVRNPETIN